jgi:hypothetical protein
MDTLLLLLTQHKRCYDLTSEVYLLPAAMMANEVVDDNAIMLEMILILLHKLPFFGLRKYCYPPDPLVSRFRGSDTAKYEYRSRILK